MILNDFYIFLVFGKIDGYKVRQRAAYITTHIRKDLPGHHGHF